MLSAPEDSEIIDLPTSRMWREASGIVCVISKKMKPQTLDEARESLRLFRDQLRGEKMCMLIDVTNSSESSREIRAFAADELPKLVKAIAMVSDSPLGRMVANLFFNLKSQPYPVKMFNDEHEARKWLIKFL